MQKITEEEAIKILDPYRARIFECAQKGFESYRKNFSIFQWMYEPRTKAGIIRDHIVANIKGEFVETPGIGSIDVKGRFFLDIEGKVLLQFKKLNKNLMPSNFQTQQQTSIDFQWEVNEQFEFDEIPHELPVLTVGYIPNDLWTDVENWWITYSYAKSVEWHVPLLDIDDTLTNIETIPLEPVETPIGTRAKPKDNKNDEKEVNER
ncbi:hypothetical protein [Nitrospina watsonii]|nr:hypothetical protein [Nitrospina watsonii]